MKWFKQKKPNTFKVGDRVVVTNPSSNRHGYFGHIVWPNANKEATRYEVCLYGSEYRWFFYTHELASTSPWSGA